MSILKGLLIVLGKLSNEKNEKFTIFNLKLANNLNVKNESLVPIGIPIKNQLYTTKTYSIFCLNSFLLNNIKLSHAKKKTKG